MLKVLVVGMERCIYMYVYVFEKSNIVLHTRDVCGFQILKK